MDVVATHVNADFDSLGSMAAARILYPGAVLTFPGSQEKSVRRFLLESSFYALDVVKAKRVNLDEISRLILVDVSSRSRIGRFSKLLNRPGVEVIVYDHHTSEQDAVEASAGRVEQVGATTTLMVEEIKKRNLPISDDDATLMILGIYEDTGGLSFPSTTPRDLEAAAFLLSNGADLSAVSQVLTPELTPEQAALLGELMKNQKTYAFHGVNVTISTADRDKYIGDLAVVAHKMRDMENLDALILLVRMDNRVHLVARSRIREVDVGKLARAMGGGGHPEASSASVKNFTLIQIHDKILNFLSSSVRPPTSARDLWTTPAKSIESSATIAETYAFLNRYHINGAPVVKSGKVAGLASRLLVGRALQHGLRDVPVSEFMITEFESASPDSSLEEIRKIIIHQNQRLLPVIAENSLLGVITRTDLLRELGGLAADSAIAFSHASQDRKAAKLMEERLSPELLKLLRHLGRKACSMGMEAYLVGGIVRDLLLRRDNQDVDVVVEGDAIALAENSAAEWGAKVRIHKIFGTAKLFMKNGLKLDLATARTEYYSKPAALPSVEWSSLKQDLYRRDFSINTLALRLTPEKFGEVIDFFGGLRDLKDGAIRILHNLSFVEDPTRILRAVRFKNRFGFKLGKQTETLMRQAVKMGFLSQAKGRRLFLEFIQLLEDGNQEKTIEELDKLGVLSAFHPNIKFDESSKKLLAGVNEAITWHRLLYLDAPVRSWMVYALAVFDVLDENEATKLYAEFGVAEGDGTMLKNARVSAYEALADLSAAANGGKPKNSRVFSILRDRATEELLFLMARTVDEGKRKFVSSYFTKLLGTEISLKGADLKQMGIKPGPIYSRLLDGLLGAKLDGEIETREDEIAWIRSRLTNQ